LSVPFFFHQPVVNFECICYLMLGQYCFLLNPRSSCCLILLNKPTGNTLTEFYKDDNSFSSLPRSPSLHKVLLKFIH
uniref:Uncharacterized protein n=1 Tax=Mola mola TaxID=94237 RepID=A0A3Q3W4Q5_MOLML